VTTSSRKIDLESVLEWYEISSYEKYMPQHVMVANKNKRWIRFGRKFKGLNRWYYSGNSEYSQYGECDDDAPTHWAPIPKGPW